MLMEVTTRPEAMSHHAPLDLAPQSPDTLSLQLCSSPTKPSIIFEVFQNQYSTEINDIFPYMEFNLLEWSIFLYGYLFRIQN